MKKVLVHGVFDVLHIGHVRLLNAAAEMGDEVVVSLLADRWVEKYKGKRPFHTILMRVEQMIALRAVDKVVVVDGEGHQAVEAMIKRESPQIYVKGADTMGTFGEEPLLHSMGIELRFVQMQEIGGKVVSTTRVREEIS